MACTIVFEWIDEFESLIESEIHTYATEQEHNQEVIVALYNILSEPQKYKSENVSLTCFSLVSSNSQFTFCS